MLSNIDLCIYSTQIFLKWQPYCGVWYTPEDTSTGYRVAYLDTDDSPEFFRPDKRYSCLRMLIDRARKRGWEVTFQIKNNVYTGTVKVENEVYEDSVSQVKDPDKSNECSLRLLLKVWNIINEEPIKEEPIKEEPIKEELEKKIPEKKVVKESEKK